MLAKSKLNSIDTLKSQALIDMDISHEEFITILKEKDRYEMMKDDLRNKNGESYEITRFNSVKSKIWKIFFSCVYIKEKYYWVFCVDNFFFLGIYKKWNIIEYFVLIKKYFFLAYNTRMLEITIDDCYKCDLETINDPNNNQYFWINITGLEIETKRSWQVIFDKYKDLSTQKYGRKSTANITFQPNKIFVRNDLFEKVIKSCKATNLNFLKLKEKLGLCLYEDICDEKEFILMSEESFVQHDVENKQLKEENKKLIKIKRKNFKKIK